MTYKIEYLAAFRRDFNVSVSVTDGVVTRKNTSRRRRKHAIESYRYVFDKRLFRNYSEYRFVSLRNKIRYGKVYILYNGVFRTVEYTGNAVLDIKIFNGMTSAVYRAFKPVRLRPQHIYLPVYSACVDIVGQYKIFSFAQSRSPTLNIRFEIVFCKNVRHKQYGYRQSNRPAALLSDYGYNVVAVFRHVRLDSAKVQIVYIRT